MTDERKDLLLKDFEHFSDCYSRNEASGDLRINFIVGLIAAGAAALGALAKKPDGTIALRSVAPLGLAMSLALLVFAALTVLRIRRRNRVTDGYLAVLGHIRETLGGDDYVRGIKERLPCGRSWKNGGLASFGVALCVLVALAAAFFVVLILVVPLGQ